MASCRMYARPRRGMCCVTRLAANTSGTLRMGPAGTPEGTYEGMIRHNVETIREALE